MYAQWRPHNSVAWRVISKYIAIRDCILPPCALSDFRVAHMPCGLDSRVMLRTKASVRGMSFKDLLLL